SVCATQAIAWAPAAVSRLSTGTLNQNLLGLAKRIYRIRCQSSGVLDRWLGCAAGGAIAKDHITHPIDGEAGHETIDHIGAVRIPCCSLRYIGSYGASSHINLIPTWSSKSAGISPPHSVGGP